MEKRCISCNKKFKTDNKKRKYCSRDCIPNEFWTKNLGKWTTPKFISERNKVSEGLKRYFLNNPRKNEEWYIKKYGRKYYPIKLKHNNFWKKESSIIRKYIIYCERCGKIVKVRDPHHIIPYTISRENKLENIIVLCRSCHKIVENFEWEIHNNFKLSWEGIRYLINSIFCEKRHICNTYPRLNKIKEELGERCQ